ncbi:PREDICTED: EF-hand calcium-binding domain-containing protein 6 [Condylura cristata]|uniref:EF-hand calcium-binding domain-containing protein 6 n=1 Tax=Condylura cristata TaxID=143302 RepID=UPI000643577B|nr:PREDICTED: EF-hand calcium-binding domain-containing protein 6 [Condylura cristata]
MKRNSMKANCGGSRVSSTKARDLMCRVAAAPDWRALCPHAQKAAGVRPHSSPCQVHSRNGSSGVSRPCSSTTAVPNPVLSSLDVKRILFQKITDKGDELRRAFQLLDADHSMTVSKSELRRLVATFLLPLTREQFQGVLAQIPLTSSGAVPYLEFLSRFGGLDLNTNATKRGNGNEKNCCRTWRELETQIGEKISKNIKSVLKAFKLIDVNRTNLVQAHELRTVLETFCLKMRDDEFKKFAKHYNIEKDTAVDYNEFLKTLTTNKDLNLRYYTGSQEISQESQQVKSSKIGECLPTHVLSEEVWKDYSLDDIERTFCQQLSRCYDKVEKALGAGDPSRRGCVSLNYLKVVLDTFVCRLPRRVFIQLMKRMGFRTTSRVDWKQFLASFHVPDGDAINGKIPVAKGNSPSRNLSGKESVVARLFRQGDRCTSLKKLLLIISAKPTGQLSGEELRHILTCSGMNISDAEFKALMRQLDPEDTRRVDVGALIQLLEGDPKTRKTSRPDTEGPLLLAWDSVEEIVRDSVTRRLQDFHHTLRSYDLGDTGLIGRNNFRRVMRTFCPFLTPDHLGKLCSMSQDPASGRVLYKQLLARMGVPGPAATSPELPQPQPGLSASTEPAQDGAPTEAVAQHQALRRLEGYFRQQDPAFRKRFLAVSRDPGGRIGAQDFRKVLADDGMAMDNDQYALLMKKLGFGPEGMSYNDFTARFQGAKMSGPEGTAPRTPESFFVTAEDCQRLFPQKLRESFRGPSGLSLGPPDQSELPGRRLPTEMQVLVGVRTTQAASAELTGPGAPSEHRRAGCGVLGALWGHPGGLGAREDIADSKRAQGARRAAPPAPLDDAPETQRAQSPWCVGSRAGGCRLTSATSTLEFRGSAKSGASTPPSEEKPSCCVPLGAERSWLTENWALARDAASPLGGGGAGAWNLPSAGDPPTHAQSKTFSFCLLRSKKKVTDSELACEQAHQFLLAKAKNRWTDLSKNFIETDHEGHGILRRRDIRNALYGFDIPLTPREFEKLWTSYDTEGRGFVTYQEFLEKLGITYSADIHRPPGEGHFNFMGHFTKPQQIQEEMKELQQTTERAALLRDQLQAHYEDISQALRRLDGAASGYTSLCGLRKVLQGCGCAVREEELTHLLRSWGIPWRNDCINYLDFLQAVENSKPTKPQPDTKEEPAPVDFSTLSPEEVLKNVQEVVAASELALAAAFLALDPEDTGFVKASDFGQVLKDFCYKLTDNQYHHVLRRLRLHLSPYIHWKYFLQNLSDFLEEGAAKWAEKMPKGPPPRPPKDAATLELLVRLHRAVAAHYRTIAQELDSFDTMKTNTVSRDAFRAVCTRHVQVLTDEQFDRLWGEMPVNAKGRLKCQDFLSRFSAEKEASPLTTGDSAQAQRGSSVPEITEEDGSVVSSPAGSQRAGSKPRSPPSVSRQLWGAQGSGPRGAGGAAALGTPGRARGSESAPLSRYGAGDRSDNVAPQSRGPANGPLKTPWEAGRRHARPQHPPLGTRKRATEEGVADRVIRNRVKKRRVPGVSGHEQAEHPHAAGEA